MSGWVAIVLIAALVFGETAIFLGFVLARRGGGRVRRRAGEPGPSLASPLIAVVVVTAVAGPLVGYEVGKRMGDRLFTARG